MTELAQVTEEAPYARRGRYFDSANAFNRKLAPVPLWEFTAEAEAALAPETGSAMIACDLGPRMGLGFPATTPLVLARYLRLRAGERLDAELRASALLHYVIAGAGVSRQGGGEIAWRAGDIFCFPGGEACEHEAGEKDCVLWQVSDEPALAFAGLRPPPVAESLVDVVHFPAADITREMLRVRETLVRSEAAGIALVFSSAAQETSRNISPTLTLAMNQLPPHGAQAAHRHNSVAVSLALPGPRCHSLVDGERLDWHPYVTATTPPGSVHSHHNDGEAWANWLIVQDGGLHYHCRTMGFATTGDSD